MREVKVTGKSAIPVALVSSVINLENIVVIGYGAVKKRTLPVLWLP